MKLVIHPAVEPDRLARPASGGARGRVGQRRRRAAEAEAAMPGADAFIGKITPAMLARADRLAMGADRSRPASNTTCSPSWRPTRAS